MPIRRRAAIVVKPAGLCAAMAGALALSATAAQANPWFERCMSPESSPAQLADACKRALDYGGLNIADQARAWTNMGVGFAELGRHGQAMEAYDGAERADPSYFGLYPNRALSREARGQVRGALQDYETALKLKPGDAGSLMGRGVLYLKRGVPDRALADFEAILLRDPQQPDALYNAGAALIALGRVGDAEKMYSRLIAVAPGDAAAWLQRGLARREAAPDAAAKDFARAMELDPFWPDPYVARGQLHDRRGDKEAANRDFRRAFELGYQSEWLTQRIQSIGG